MDITPEILRDLLAYDPLTGIFTWKPRSEWYFPDGKTSPERRAAVWNGARAGRTALNTKHCAGYRMGRVFDKGILAHRAAWAVHYGAWPQGEIDHINRIRHDNRIENLRDVSRSINALNRNGGVSYETRRKHWVAYSGRAGKRTYLGSFPTEKEAQAAREAYLAAHVFG